LTGVDQLGGGEVTRLAAQWFGCGDDDGKQRVRGGCFRFDGTSSAGQNSMAV
jgi:hypothetical protein